MFWIVAEKNIRAYKLYEKFVQKYCKHQIGKIRIDNMHLKTLDDM